MSEGLIFDHYPMRDTEPPAGWAMCSVGCVAESISSGFPSGAHNSEGRGVPHIRPMNIDRVGRFDLSSVKSVDGDIPKLLAKGDVLFNNTNSPELIGKTTLIPIDDRLAYSNHMTRIRVEQGMNPSFVAKQLHFLWMSGYFRHRCKNHVNQASIAAEPLSRTVPLLVAPSSQQDRIADELDELLSELDAGVEALERVRAKLGQYRAGVLKAAVSGELSADWREKHPATEPASELLQRILAERRRRWEEAQLQKFQAAGKAPPKDWKSKYPEPVAPDTTNLPPLPSGWCWTNTESTCDFITKGTTPPGNDAPKPEGEIPFIKVQHLSGIGAFHFSESPAFISQYVHSNGPFARSKVVPGDVLMNLVGPPLGQVSVVPDLYPEWNVNQAIAILRTVAGLLNRYLAICLLTDAIIRRALSRTKTTAGQVNLTLEISRELPIPLPSAEEQLAIVEAVEDQLSVIDHLEADLDAKLQRSSGLRQSILHHAFTGRLVPQDPSDEPASELLKRIAAEREQRQRQIQAEKNGKPKTKTSRKRAVKSRK